MATDNITKEGMSGYLANLSKAERWLESAVTLPDIKKVVNIAQAASDFAKAAKLGEQACAHAFVVKTEAIRKAGELLAQLEKGKNSGPGRGNKTKSHDEKLFSPYRQAIEEAEIDHNTASRWQQVAAIPEPKYQAYIQDNNGKELTTAGLLREARSEPKKKEHGVWDFADASDRIRKAVDREIAAAGDEEIARVVYILRVIITELGYKDKQTKE